MSTASSRDDLPLTPLLVLAGAMFISMTSEYLPGGLIPLVAGDFDRSVAQVGQLVSVFALTVVVSTVPASWLTRKMSRKTVVVVALAGIGAATLLAAAAPTFEVLLVSRLIGGLAHGLFWSSAAAYAANLVPPSKLGRATAITSAGGALAGIVGISIGSALGYWVGWRFAFGAIALLAALALVLVIKLLPPVDHHVPVVTGEIRIPGHRDLSLRPVLLTCLVIVVVVAGVGAYSTYGVVWLLDIGGLEPRAVPLLLGASGVVGALGLLLIGRLADRRPVATLLIAMGVVGLAHGILGVIGSPHALAAIIALTLTAGLAFAVVPSLLQVRTMRAASPRLRTFAAALLTTAINVGIGGGAVVGGISLEGAGLASLPFTAAALIAVALAILVSSSLWQWARLVRRERGG